MNRQEILNYLLEKRKIVAPVAIAINTLLQAEKNLYEAKRKFKKTILFLIILGVLMLISNSGINDYTLVSIPCFIAALALYFIRKYFWIAPARRQLAEAQQLYESEISVKDYIEGVKGFPEKFYNYSDVYRLWKLIDEGRASTLPEAYNLLENQQFQEVHLSKQEEFAALQTEIAGNSRIAAYASVISAVNSFK